MTEKTISEVLAQYPDCKEFVSINGITWVREELCLARSDNDAVYVHDNCHKHVSIPGLRPKPQKRKVTVNGFIPYGALFNELHAFSHRREEQSWLPATLTYEVSDE